MTSRKFLTLIKTPKASTMHIWATFSQKKVHLIMDEVDEIKEDWNVSSSTRLLIKVI